MEMENKPQGLDSGGFLAGLIKTVLSSSSGGNMQGGVISNFLQKKKKQNSQLFHNFIYNLYLLKLKKPSFQ